MTRIGLVSAAAVLVLAACSSGNPPATQQPGGSTPGATNQPPVTTPAPNTSQEPAPTGVVNAGDFKSKAQALIPPGSTQTAEYSTATSYTVYATTTMSINDLIPFWEGKFASLGLTETGKFQAQGTVTIAVTNPDGGITAATDESTGETTFWISLGTSS